MQCCYCSRLFFLVATRGLFIVPCSYICLFNVSHVCCACVCVSVVRAPLLCVRPRPPSATACKSRRPRACRSRNCATRACWDHRTGTHRQHADAHMLIKQPRTQRTRSQHIDYRSFPVLFLVAPYALTICMCGYVCPRVSGAAAFKE